MFKYHCAKRLCDLICFYQWNFIKYRLKKFKIFFEMIIEKKKYIKFKSILRDLFNCNLSLAQKKIKTTIFTNY